MQVIIALISIKILTEVLTEKEVGNYYLLLTLLTLFNFAFLNPLGQYYGRHLIHWEHNKNLLNATNVLIFLRLSAIVFSLVIAFGVYNIFKYNIYYSIGEFLLFIFISLIAGTHGVLLNAVNTLGDRIKFITYVVSTLVVGLILSLFIVFLVDKSGMGWLYGVAISQLLFSIGLYKYIIKNNYLSIEKIKSAFSRYYIKQLTIFIIPVMITLFLQWGQNVSYRFIIEAKYSIETVAYIGVGLTISGAIFSAVESLASQFYNPIYLRKITNANKEDRSKAWNELANYMIPIYILLAVFVITLSPYLANLLVAQKFYEAYVYAMFGAIIELFRVIINLVYIVSQSEIKTNTTILPYLIGFIISVITLYLLDLDTKLWAIPLVLGIANFIIFVLMFINMRKLLDINIKIVSLFKALLLSIPFGVVLLLENNHSLMVTLSVVLVSGLYFLYTVYLLRPIEYKERIV